MLRALLIVMAAWPVAGQVVVNFSPMPMASVKAAGVKDVGPWSIYACNNGAQMVTIPAERFYLAAPGIRFVDALHARLLLPAQQAKTVWGRVASGLRGASAGATVGMALAGTNPWVIGATAAVQVAVPVVQQWIRGETPALEPYLANLLDAPVVLAPQGCATRTAFAAKMPKPVTVAAVLVF